MMRLLLGLLALLIVLPAQAQDPAAARASIEAALADSDAGWNGRDLDRFLGVYSDDPETIFTTSAGAVRGKAAIRARYLESYGAVFGEGESDMTPPALRMEIVDFRMLGADHAQIVARWFLADARTGKEQSGMTTLVFRREAGGWKIVSDHSS